MLKESVIIKLGSEEMKEAENIVTNENGTEKQSSKPKGLLKNFVNEWVIPILAALAIWFVFNKLLFMNIVLPPSGSMIPTLNDNDKLIATRVWDKDSVKRGDIIVFKSEELDNKDLIKRVIGLPGDHVSIINGVVKVNGEEIVESYVKNNELYTNEFDVPDGKIFFLGDNRSNSYDSRYWKNPYIDKSCIEGKARFRYYPFNDMKVIK